VGEDDGAELAAENAYGATEGPDSTINIMMEMDSVRLGIQFFKNSRIDQTFVLAAGDADSKYLEQIRANIYAMFRVNDCLLGYPGFEINLTPRLQKKFQGLLKRMMFQQPDAPEEVSNGEGKTPGQKSEGADESGKRAPN
jgi:hypothetical protein